MGDRDPLEIISLFVGKGSRLSISRPLIDLTGDLACALFIGECIHWSEWARREGKEKLHAEGWFHRTHDEWWEHDRLTREQVMRAKTVCAPLGIEYAKKGVPAKGHYRVNRAVLADALGLLRDGMDPKELRQRMTDRAQLSGNPTTSGSASSDGETLPPVVGKPDDWKSGNPTTSTQGNPTTNNRANTEQTQSKHRAVKPLSSGDDETGKIPTPEIPREEPQTPPVTPSQDSVGKTGKASGQNSADDSEKVPGGAAAAGPAKPASLSKFHTDMQATYHKHANGLILSACKTIDAERRRLLDALLKELGGDQADARRTLALATRVAATRKTFMEAASKGTKYGLTNVLRHAVEFAEAATPAMIAAVDGTPLPPPVSTPAPTPQVNSSGYSVDMSVYD